ncbi:MAG TPA: type I 3-dehydroquinate dehydratase [Dehalococcoidia bacterium]|nr:type I 3-dehydroquinate dehydratase [Dehalococcoidia bacterium]
MKPPRICATITSDDIKAVRNVESMVTLFEVRIDLIGDDWTEIAHRLTKPWIACNRSAAEGGSWQDSEARRIEKLLQAIDLGADIIDVELKTKNLVNLVKLIKRRKRCLLSYHNLEKTPSVAAMKQIVQQQIKAGADICKIVTTANSFEDNISILTVISEFPEQAIVAFAMGPAGAVSRVLCPLAGGEFTYASIARGKESAPGQMTVNELHEIYRTMRTEDSP